ncbi:hypothetical protein WKT22_02521 [Candidatus Lokiarchaeum ossiferum]
MIKRVFKKMGLSIEEMRIQNRKFKAISAGPKPFLKWVGGKRQLLKQIDPFLPSTFNKYIEPFVGGGALFFYLLPENAILIDNNPVLINCYQVIQKKIDPLIEALRGHKNESDYYYSIRNVDRLPEFSQWTDVQKAARIMYMNKCCFNGLYRVNSKGFFNVPFGKYKNPRFLDEENLRAIHTVLQTVTIQNGSFTKSLDHAKKNDFVYFDPPYYPITKTANFTSYTKDNFSEHDQIHLAKIFKELDNRGCKLMLSNSYCDFILDLYKDFHIEKVHAKRAINSDASKRGAIKEVLVMNY